MTALVWVGAGQTDAAHVTIWRRNWLPRWMPRQVAKPYVLVGHSFGGLLVQAFAHTYPERTAAIVLLIQ